MIPSEANKYTTINSNLKTALQMYSVNMTNSDMLTLDIWGSSVPVSLEDHLHHRTAPEAQRRQVGVTWNKQ